VSLTRRPKEVDKAAELVQLVAFVVGEGRYALDIMRIKEIINPVKVTAVPKAPAFIEGVIELRGAILPVVDMRKRFDLPAGAPTRTTKFLIVALDVGGRRMIVGLVVDGVLEPLRVTREQIRPAPALTTGEAAFFSGVVNRRRAQRDAARKDQPEDDEGIFMLLDIDAILSSKEKITLAGMDAPSGGAA
jgi:purine-binding chemotaxis protein CheW